jgi:phosphatidate cytidylyltransferase
LADQDPTDKDGQDFNRPWEDDDQETAEIVPLPGIGKTGAGASAGASAGAEPEGETGASSDGDTGDELGDTPGDEPDGDEADVFALADDFATEATDTTDTGEGETDDSDADADSESGDVDWDAMAEGPSSLDDFTPGKYTSATTEEYKGLAEDVNRAAEEDWEMQAVAAAVSGVESGLVGFEDVSGTVTHSEESYEALEQAAASDITMRIASALAIFGLFLGSLLLGDWWFTAFVILVMVVSVGELYANLRTRGYTPIALFGIIGVILVGVGAHNWGAAAIGGWAAVVTLGTILFFSLSPRKNPTENASVTVLGVAWVGMLAFAILIGNGPHPVAQILFIVLLIALNDIGAFFVGKAFGRRKLAPNVSPNKTIEGFIGGLLVAALAASILVTFPPWEAIGLARALGTAAVIGLFSPLGDLVESMVKRSIDVKDMGSVLPGHGGMLDRIDGFLFAVPAVYFLFRAFELL